MFMYARQTKAVSKPGEFVADVVGLVSKIILF
jgi:hypothetical protein